MSVMESRVGGSKAEVRRAVSAEWIAFYTGPLYRSGRRAKAPTIGAHFWLVSGSTWILGHPVTSDENGNFDC